MLNIALKCSHLEENCPIIFSYYEKAPGPGSFTTGAGYLSRFAIGLTKEDGRVLSPPSAMARTNEPPKFMPRRIIGPQAGQIPAPPPILSPRLYTYPQALHFSLNLL